MTISYEKYLESDNIRMSYEFVLQKKRIIELESRINSMQNDVLERCIEKCQQHLDRLEQSGAAGGSVSQVLLALKELKHE